MQPSRTRLRRSIPALVALCCMATLSTTATHVGMSDDTASAAAGDGITAYISPPFVQGPPSSVGATIETFDSPSFCSLPRTTSVGTYSGSCTSLSSGGESIWGGANTTTDVPTVGGTPSPFVAAWNTQVLTLTFATPARYVGFWWSAGSAGNQVNFYNSSNVVIATFDTDDLNALLNTSGASETSVLPPNPYPGSQVVTALDGSAYKKGYYFGRPADHTSLTPTVIPSSNINIYSHAYLNVFASGAITFSKVQFIGGGFEFDNVAVSDQVRTPTNELVFLQSVLGKSVDFRANGGTGTMPAQTSDALTTLTTNTFTRAGHTFAGWHTTSSGTGGTSYADEATYSFASDLVLHAQWTATPYTVTYNSQGGSSVTSGSYTIGSTVTLPTAPTRAGFTFNGWFAAASGGTALGATYAPPSTGAITLFAQWTADPSATPPASSEPATTATTVAPPAPASPPLPTLEAPRRVRGGSVITVVARGFAPGESVQMSVGDSGKTRAVIADSNGEVRLTVRLTTNEDGERVLAQAVAGSRKVTQEIQIADSPATLPSTGASTTELLLVSALLCVFGIGIVIRRRWDATEARQSARSGNGYLG